MKVLYISNIEVPYRTEFFNQLANKCELTVLYERKRSSNRNSKWTSAVSGQYVKAYLDGFATSDENAFSFSIFSWLVRKWDAVIIGCFNSPVQIAAVFFMLMLRRPYIVNLDGDAFIGKNFKGMLKKFILKHAALCLCAGEKCSAGLGGITKKSYPYYFSSLTEAEVLHASGNTDTRDGYVLVAGQYYAYKGMDVALKVAEINPDIRFKFIGMSGKTELFKRDMGEIPDNVEIIPFLQKDLFVDQIRRCGVLLLPSRKECWGLVINEAAAYGTPVVSTYGSGAAVEFLQGTEYEKYLAVPGDAESLSRCLRLCLNEDNSSYSEFLKLRSRDYTIERNVDIFMSMIKDRF